MDFGNRITRIGKLGATYTIGTVFLQALGLLLIPVFTYYLDPEQMGIVSLSVQIMTVLIVLTDLGLVAGFTSHYFRVDDALRSSMVRSVAIGQLSQGVLVAALLLIAGVWIAPPLLAGLPLSNPHRFVLWCLMVSGSLLAVIVSLAVRLARLEERGVLSVVIEALYFFVQASVGLVAVVVLGWRGLGRQGTYVMGLVAASALSCVIIWRRGGRPDAALYRRAFRTGLSFVPHNFSGIVALTFSAWLLSRLVSAAALGIYGVALVFARLLETCVRCVGAAAYPTLARLMTDGGQEAREQQSRIYTLAFTGFLFIALGISLFAPMIIRLVFRPDYHDAAPLVPVLTVAWLFQGVYTISVQALIYKGRGLSITVATGASALVNIVACLVMVPTLGMYGAAIAIVVSSLVRAAVITFFSHRECRLRWQVSAMVRAAALVAALGCIDLWLSPSLPWAVSAVVKTGFLLAIVPLLWLIGVFKTKELTKACELVVDRVRSFRQKGPRP